MAGVWYNEGKRAVLAGEIQPVTDDLKVMLLPSYTPNIDTHQNYDDVSASEHGATGGYTLGGESLGTKAVTTDATLDRAEFTAANTVWTTSTLSAQWAILYFDSTVDSTSTLLCYWDFGSTKSSTAADFTLQWDAEGILQLA